jgi:biotin operon repressor
MTAKRVPTPFTPTLSASRFVSREMSVLACLADAPASTPAIGELIGLNRVGTWRIVRALRLAGLLIECETSPRSWRVTSRGLLALEELRRDLDFVIAQIKDQTRLQTK